METGEELRRELYRTLPSVNDLILAPACQALADNHSPFAIVSAARESLANLRREIACGQHTMETLRQSLAVL